MFKCTLVLILKVYRSFFLTVSYIPGHASSTVPSLHAHHVSIGTQATFEHFVYDSYFIITIYLVFIIGLALLQF